jgi:hypothetical protein
MTRITALQDAQITGTSVRRGTRCACLGVSGIHLEIRASSVLVPIFHTQSTPTPDIYEVRPAAMLMRQLATHSFIGVHTQL